MGSRSIRPAAVLPKLTRNFDRVDAGLLEARKRRFVRAH